MPNMSPLTRPKMPRVGTICDRRVGHAAQHGIAGFRARRFVDEGHFIDADHKIGARRAWPSRALSIARARCACKARRLKHPVKVSRFCASGAGMVWAGCVDDAPHAALAYGLFPAVIFGHAAFVNPHSVAGGWADAELTVNRVGLTAKDDVAVVGVKDVIEGLRIRRRRLSRAKIFSHAPYQVDGIVAQVPIIGDITRGR